MSAALRLAGSLLMALTVAGALLLGGARLHGALSASGEHDTALRPVTVDAWPDGVALPGDSPPPGRRDLPALPGPPPVSGHVQLDVRVDAAGRVVEARVVDATVPSGLRDLAREEVLQRRYPAGPARFSETIDFAAAD